MDQASRLRQLVSGDSRALAAPRLWSPTPDSSLARVTAVTSGKGGVGKTVVSVNLALLFAEMRERVLLVDVDLGLANVDVMLDMDPVAHIGHLLLPDSRAEDVAADGPYGVKVISGGSGLRELADAGSIERLTLLSKLRTYFGAFDRVVIDTSPGIGSDVTDFLGEADEILLVTTGEPTALRDTYAASKAIVQTMPDAEIIPVVNCATERQASQAMNALNQVTRRFLGREFERRHAIESDPMMARAVAERKPIVKSYPRSPAAICLRKLAADLATRKKPRAVAGNCVPADCVVALVAPATFPASLDASVAPAKFPASLDAPVS